MRCFLLVGVCLVAIGAAPVIGPIDQPHHRPYSLAIDDYPRRIGIDVEHYRFELTLRDDTDAIDGRATISVRFRNNGVIELPLDLTGDTGAGSGMAVSRVTAGGAELAFSHSDDVLRISLPEVGRAGDRMDVTVSYAGVPAAGLRAGPNKYGDRTFFSDNWPNQARNWLPTIDHPYDKATSEMLVTAPAHYQVVSNGALLEETDRPDGTRVTHWKESAPIATWLYVLGVARFAVQQVDDFRGVPIQTWVYGQDRDEGFHDFAVPTKQVLEFYSDHVGPFAYEKLANITSPATGGGMEAASAIMYGEASVTGERTERWRNVIIHEIAHQWFGNAVTESDWDDVWLSEGFATYFTLLFIEHAYGHDEFIAGLGSAADRVFSQYADDPGYRVVHDRLDDMGRVTSGATYQKGAWILHMLRRRMGDEAFWDGIRQYYARYMNGNATTTDFRMVMEEVSGLDLATYFDQWLYSGGNPHLEGWWEYDASAKAVLIELSQTQSAGPTFEFPLEVGIRFGNEAAPFTIERVEVDGRFHRFVIPVDSQPIQVTLDPNTSTLFSSDFGARNRS
jgi:aminopeptidase N